jgi:hypothetical protein
MKLNLAPAAFFAFEGCQGSQFCIGCGIQAIKRLLNGSIAVCFQDDSARKTAKREICSY